MLCVLLPDKLVKSIHIDCFGKRPASKQVVREDYSHTIFHHCHVFGHNVTGWDKDATESMHGSLRSVLGSSNSDDHINITHTQFNHHSSIGC